jgi:hypothetical protein
MGVARREYFEGFRRLADDMVRLGAEAPGGRYPMEPARFVDTTTQQLGTLLGVMHAAGHASEMRTAELVASARAGLVGTLTLLVLGLVVAIGTGWLVCAASTRPLAVLAAATSRLRRATLKPRCLVPVAATRWGRVARALGSAAQ